ncbi:hypothetical protein SXIM_02280 [Streptomyces xiamenensis]|uniref:Uncharacterized protein n=1 Tax=Streptomyces xiamenensis TaxID=408015 RepID=A0A0F7FP37_9ACTN|nr:hypothetical protein SXIM_02280 [Streptomyces xiamenensis]
MGRTPRHAHIPGRGGATTLYEVSLTEEGAGRRSRPPPCPARRPLRAGRVRRRGRPRSRADRPPVRGRGFGSRPTRGRTPSAEAPRAIPLCRATGCPAHEPVRVPLASRRTVPALGPERRWCDHRPPSDLHRTRVPPSHPPPPDHRSRGGPIAPKIIPWGTLRG